MKGKYLITTDNWFVAPDGNEYKAVWGDITILDDTVLGVKTNRNSVNWYVKVGTEENHVIVAGCQMHYACRSDKKPSTERSLTWNLDASNYNEALAPTKIYITE